MRENRTSETVWGVSGNRHSYHDGKGRRMVPIVIATLIVICLLGVALLGQGNDGRPISKGAVEQRLFDRWRGWIEVSNTDFKPMFLGKILGTTGRGDEMLLVGVLLAENIPSPLADALMSRECPGSARGKIPVRCLSGHDQELIVSKLEQQEVIDSLQAYVSEPRQIDNRVVLNSHYVTHVDNDEGIAEFDAMWDQIIETPEAEQSQFT